MRTIFFVVALCVLPLTHLFGRIMNGYESQVQSSKVSLRELSLLLAESKDLSMVQRLRVRSEIDNLINYISYYELTEELIRQLRVVSPAIYTEIDNIEDKRGRPTDVYVKLIPKEKTRIQLEGASFFEQSSGDEDANHSEYGDYSVSVEIWISNNALLLLSHELGHIKYIVPNLAAYAKYYDKYYAKNRMQLPCIGHRPHDQSGKMANNFVKRFLEDRKTYSQYGERKTEAFFSLLARIRKTVRTSDGNYSAKATASNTF